MKKRFILVLLVLILGIDFSNLPQQSIRKLPQQCPPNPELLNPPSSEFGLVPHSMDLSHLERTGIKAIAALPAAWDWRDLGGVTPAKKQGSCNVWWAFAATGVLESTVLIESGTAYDFSEENMKECNFWGRGCLGGTIFKALSYLTTLGTVSELCDPYSPDTTGVCNSSCPKLTQVTGWRLIGSTDPAAIKDVIYQYGPVNTIMYASFPGFSTYDGSYVAYYTGNEGTNHAVMIVGWDDNMSHAGGTGAWICKNSWGTAWGDEGFFYIAYGSARIGGMGSYFNQYKMVDPAETLYHYDEGGWEDSYGFGSSDTAWGLVKFTASNNQNINAVDFWAVARRVEYTIRIYDDFNGTAVSNLLYSQSGEFATGAGYYSIPLNTSVPIQQGDDFYIVIRMRTPGYNFPTPTDPWDSYAPIETGKCYMSPNGSPGTWVDTGTTYSRDIGIRARAISSSGYPDFNDDGISDILWRYYGSGGYNAVWLRGTSGNSSSRFSLFKSLSGNNQKIVDMDTIGFGENIGDVSLNGVNVSRFMTETQEGLPDGFLDFDNTGEKSKEFFSDPFETAESNGELPGNRVRASLVPDPRDDPEAVEIASSPNLDWKLCGTGDFNSDGEVDLVWRNTEDGRNAVWLMNGTTVDRIRLLPSESNPMWTLCGTGDFNSDGKVDLVWRNVANGNNSIWLMDGLSLSEFRLLPSAVNLNWTLCGTGDFNRDNQDDLVWRNTADGRNVVWLMNGVNLFRVRELPSATNLSWTLCGAADFNNDRNTDLLWRNISDGKNVIWHLNGLNLQGVEWLTTVSNTTWKIEN